jgi:hypothetical protein
MAFAKLATFEILDELHRAYGPAAPRAYVDDMAMMLVELTQSALLGTLRPAVLNFGAVQMAMMARLPETVRAGGSSFAAVHGSEMWDFYAAHPDAHAVFVPL